MHKGLLVILSTLGVVAMQANAEYSIPPGRSINWFPAGLDVVGGIPTIFASTNAISGLHPDGSVDDSGTINSAISGASSNTVLTIAAGTYKIGSDIQMGNGVVLRGAKQEGQAPFLTNSDAMATTLKMTNGARVIFDGRGGGSWPWTPGAQSGYSITAGYGTGSNVITCAAAVGNVAVGDFISIYQNNDSAWIDDKGEDYVGEDSSPSHCFQQYSKVIAVNGNNYTIDPPVYLVTPSPTGQSIRKQNFQCVMSGLENMRIYGDESSLPGLVMMMSTRYCWIKGVETYGAGSSSSDSAHIWMKMCYANEVSHCYCHVGASHDSGANYGIEITCWNSRHKVENNIVMETRHAIITQGGGSGCVFLYNYLDNNWESVQGEPTTIDNTILSEAAVPNHGAHPHMNLWEGNSTENFEADYTLGSSSHNTAFRNSFRGYRTSYPLSGPWFWNLVEIQQYNRYYNLIGNIVGNPTMTSGGTIIDNNSGGTLPEMFRFGVSSDGGSYTDTNSYATAILQGNYDFVSKSVHNWSDTNNETLPTSLYYTNTPSYFGKLTWPPYDISRVSAAQIDRTNIPAGYRYVEGVDPLAGSQLPSISLTSPTNGASFVNPATINLAASVTANGHAITQVQFYNGVILLGEDTSTPYTLSWNNVTNGSYNLTALAVYDTNATIDSAAVNITVQSMPLPLGLHVEQTSGL
jgi:hypothetical protein